MIHGFHHAKTTMVTHQNDELLRHKPAHVAHRQPEAVPEEPEEQRVVLQVVSEPNLSKSNTCSIFSAWTPGFLKRVVMDVYPRLFEISSL